MTTIMIMIHWDRNRAKGGLFSGSEVGNSGNCSPLSRCVVPAPVPGDETELELYTN